MIVGPPGGMAQRQFWLNPPTVDNIIKRLHYEMRNARLQNKDLQRTQEFLDVLLTSDDIKNEGKTDGAEPAKSHVANGNSADLEEMLLKEREARLHAEDMMQKMEVNNHTGKTNGVAGSLMTNGASELDMAFEPPMDRPLTPEPSADGEESEYARAQDDKFEASTAKFEARIDAMLDEMRGLREQLEAYRQRAEQAEQERDADRKTLAELTQRTRAWGSRGASFPSPTASSSSSVIFAVRLPSSASSSPPADSPAPSSAAACHARRLPSISLSRPQPPRTSGIALALAAETAPQAAVRAHQNRRAAARLARAGPPLRAGEWPLAPEETGLLPVREREARWGRAMTAGVEAFMRRGVARG
ncbi:hypothetical protein P8C59_009503 [Phyllachora maydis]|uniref:Uncharacterized protein n=1 Tax=Phyllachora maydis TaxID=1825666 RepID=A0AAD9MFP2_9PEZI|nr:hypothetical protein P8C59_009503 [Phyllachora maydis]